MTTIHHETQGAASAEEPGDDALEAFLARNDNTRTAVSEENTRGIGAAGLGIPLDEAPAPYTNGNTYTGQGPMDTDTPPADFQTTDPQRPERKHWLRKPTTWVAVGATAILGLVGAMVGPKVFAGGDKHAKGVPAASSTLKPGAGKTGQGTASASAAPSEQAVPAGGAPKYIQSEVTPYGNVDTEVQYPDQGTVVSWSANPQQYLPLILAPSIFYGPHQEFENSTQNASGEIAANLEFLWDDADTNSPGYVETLNRFTDNPTLQATIIKQNQRLQELYPEGNQFIMFDEHSSPSTAGFGGDGSVNLNNPLISDKGSSSAEQENEEFLRVLNLACHMDPNAPECTPDSTQPLARFGESRADAVADAVPISIESKLKAVPNLVNGLQTVKVDDLEITLHTNAQNAPWFAGVPGFNYVQN